LHEVRRTRCDDSLMWTARALYLAPRDKRGMAMATTPRTDPAFLRPYPLDIFQAVLLTLKPLEQVDYAAYLSHSAPPRHNPFLTD
jgi:hypothetical protein